MLSTHDLQLTTISKDIPHKISNYHFDINMIGDKLEFDFKLKNGICKSFNAKHLLEELGLYFNNHAVLDEKMNDMPTKA
jgi:DNA mismatch repair ATPase MutS